MKVLCLLEPGNLVIKDLPMPKLEEGQAIVKMEMCGICSSGVTAYGGVSPTMHYPISGLDHEGVGIIQEIGENDKGLEPGDRVTLEPHVPCNKCHMYAVRRFNNYTDLHVHGVHEDGMMSEYFLHPVQLLHKLPDELAFTHAALVELLTIDLHRAARTRVPRGEHCVVFGAGIIGLVVAFACINCGATPILVDMLRRRLDCARELGVPCTFNSRDENVEKYLREVTSGELPEAMIDCMRASVILGNVHNHMRHEGRIALVEQPHDPVLISTVHLIQKEIDVRPSRDSNGKFPEAIGLVNEGKIPTDAIITEMIELDQVEDTVKDMIQSPSDYLEVIVNI